MGLPSFPRDQISFLVRKDLSSNGILYKNSKNPKIRVNTPSSFFQKYVPRALKNCTQTLRNCSILFRPVGLKPSKLSWKNRFEVGRLMVKAILMILSHRQIENEDYCINLRFFKQIRLFIFCSLVKSI